MCGISNQLVSLPTACGRLCDFRVYRSEYPGDFVAVAARYQERKRQRLANLHQRTVPCLALLHVSDTLRHETFYKKA